MEKPAKIENEHIDINHTVQKVETTDIPEDLGGDARDIPSGYWKSYKFIGSIVGIFFMSMSLYLGFVLPVSQPFSGVSPSNMVSDFCDRQAS